MKTIHNVSTISEFHKLLGLQSPDHPLISVIHTKDLPKNLQIHAGKYKFNFYIISLKTSCHSQFKYGRNSYDFDEGSMSFTASGQVFDFQNTDENQLNTDEGWTVVFHPDFIRHTSLTEQISEYTFLIMRFMKHYIFLKKKRKCFWSL